MQRRDLGLRRLLEITGLLVLAAGAGPASAQLNETCTVSVLNRTAAVQPDGSWVLPNVPATIGQVRVRATCVENGVTRSGQSDFFAVPVGDVIQVANISFDAPVAVPAALELSAQRQTLTSPGETVQLLARVRLPDGSTVDVTPSTAGTNYTISNPRIATVDAEGIVTARVSGNVVVSAANEGTIGALTLAVVLSGDSDGDGLPDDFELANGLDPNNAADALGDPDQDGLATGDEFQAGLDPFDADSDDDTLTDGREVNETGTNPLLFDTDGDQIGDGLELFAGSDPRDGNSINLAPILTGLSAEPASFTLIFNTLIGEASRRLVVSGSLIDGTVIDITGGIYGTTYLSTNLAVASFGLESGRVFAGADGSAAVTARNSGFEDSVEVRVQSFAPTALSFLDLPGAANAIALDGGHAFVAAGNADLVVVDVSNPAVPVLRATRVLPGEAFDVAVAGGYAYVAAGSGGLQVVDVSNPASPLPVGGAAARGSALAVATSPGYALVADGTGLRVFDVALPNLPRLVGEVALTGRPRGVALSGRLAVVAAESQGVHVVDWSNPAAPVRLGSTHTRANGTSDAADVAVRNRTAYVADGARTLGGLKIVDFSVPSTPAVTGASSDAFGLNDVAIEDRFAFTADYFFANAVPIFQVGTPIPVFSAVLDFSRAPSFRDDNGMSVAVRDGLVYLVGDRYRIARFGFTGSSALHIGRYARFDELINSPQPPSVSITAPVNGASVVERNTLRITAVAADDVAVRAVDFLVGGAVVATDVAAPYEHTLVVPAGVTALELRAVARDYAGLTTSSETVSLVVEPDDAPAVRLLAPVDGARATEGATLVAAAEATDDVSVARVEFLRDGVLAVTDTAAPYTANLNIPLGATSVQVAARAFDNVGQQAMTPAVTVAVEIDNPPTVGIVEPSPEAEVIQGSTLRIVAGAADDVGVNRVEFRVDATPVATDFSAPFEASYAVPVTATELTLTAVATDTVGRSTSSAALTLAVIPDPGTTVVGSVLLEDGTPAAGATVTAVSVSTTANADGTFELVNVPTVQGSFTVSAALTTAAGNLRGRSLALLPIAGGVTDAGQIVVRLVRAVGYWDMSFNSGSSTQVAGILTAGLEARNVGNLNTFDLNEVGILLVQNPNNGGYTTTWFNNRPRVFDWIAAGGVLVFHDRAVSGAATALPGSPGTIVRDFADGSNINILDGTTRVTNGPGGVLTNSSLDGGNFSSHGWALLSTLPAGSQAILSTGDPTHVVTYSYPFGLGRVVYSTIPLDFYLTGSGSFTVSSNMRNIYAPNVIAYANDLR